MRGFLSIFWISFILVIWFETDFLIEYARIIGVWKNLARDYQIFKLKTMDGNFPSFLVSLRDCFATRLAACPFCLGFWVSLVFSVGNWRGFAANYILSLIVYLIVKKLI